MEGKNIPLLVLGRLKVECFIGSKEEKFHRNLKRWEVRGLVCLGFGGITLEKKRSLGSRC